MPSRAGLVILLLAAALIVFNLAQDDGGSGPRLAGYGQQPGDVARKLHGCRSIQVAGSLALCRTAAGDATVETVSTAREQAAALETLRLTSPRFCAVQVPGVVIAGRDLSALASLLGEQPARVASRDGGQVLCPLGR